MQYLHANSISKNSNNTDCREEFDVSLDYLESLSETDEEVQGVHKITHFFK